MPLTWVLVRAPAGQASEQNVFVNHDLHHPAGMTGTPFQVETGVHTFKLQAGNTVIAEAMEECPEASESDPFKIELIATPIAVLNPPAAPNIKNPEKKARKKPAPKKKAARKAAPKRKAAAKKKAAPKRKAAAKRKAAPKRKTAAKRKGAPKRKAATKRKAAPKRKAATKKKTAAKRKTSAKRKTAAKTKTKRAARGKK
jgi:hypothetical protein